MYPTLIWESSEKFLAEINKLNVRFKSIETDKSANHLLVVPEHGHGQIIYNVPDSAVALLSENTLRVGTLLKLENIKVQMNGVMIAHKVSVSNEENFDFRVDRYITSKKGVHTFEGFVSRVIPTQDTMKNASVDLTGPNALLLKRIFANRAHASTVTLKLRNLEETGYREFKQTVDLTF